MSVAPPGPEREHTSLEYSGDTEASSLQKINMTVVNEDPTNTKNDTNSKDVGEKTLEKGVGNEGVIHSAVSAASSPHNQQGTAAHNVETSLQQDEETTDPSTNLTATVLVSDTTGREDEALGKEAGDEYRTQSAGPAPTQHNTGERRLIPAQVDLNFLLGQLVGGNRGQLEQGSVESEGSLAVNCPEIPESGSPADCQEIPTPGSPANCPEIPTPGSPADCPEIPTPAFLSDCPEIPTPAFLSDCPEIPTPAFLSDCPEIPTSGSPAEIPVLESTTEVSHPRRQTGYIEKHHADGDSAMKIENAESSMSPTHIPATGTYPATRLTHKPEEVGVVNDEKIEIDNLCEKNAFLKNGKVKRLDSGYDDDCGDNGGKFWSGRWSPTRKPLPENGEEGNLMLDLVAESRSHAPGYVVIPMKQITPSV
ncbi:hypothetical protein BaRGS_00019748 [Batillaria attramentaria]|uniref:Uncharacterized protein n=1 Tax=Batillaria attramentaria TaxID=370345 RepID=A0ABD0KQD8_9CAEN